MKSLLLVFFALVPSVVLAAPVNCDGNGEAQIIAKVTSSSAVTSHSCRVEISYPRFFQPNQLCPLAIDDALLNPIKVEMSAGVCPAPGSEISGLLSLQFDGSLVLE